MSSLKQLRRTFIVDTSSHVVKSEHHRRANSKWTAVRKHLQEMGFPFHEATPVDMSDVLLAHCPRYVRALEDEALTAAAVRRIGISGGWQAARDRVLHVNGAVVEATKRVASARFDENAGRDKIVAASVIGGGGHHAHYDFGSGYCVFNDIAVAAYVLRRDFPRIRKILSIDLDVHQGDGTATMLDGLSDTFTLSFHAKSNFPFRRAKSDLDMDFADGTGDEEYLHVLEDTLQMIDVKFGRPDFVFYQAGVDVLSSDRLGRLNMSPAGVRARDRIVYNWCKRWGASSVSTTGGGYYDDQLSFIECVSAHCAQIQEMVDVLEKD